MQEKENRFYLDRNKLRNRKGKFQIKFKVTSIFIFFNDEIVTSSNTQAILCFLALFLRFGQTVIRATAIKGIDPQVGTNTFERIE